MRILKIAIIMIILIMSVGAVCAADDASDDLMGDDNQDILEISQNDVSAVGEPKTFTDLETDIFNSTDVFDVENDYTYDDESDKDFKNIVIGKDNFVINGNGRTIDAGNQKGLFIINGTNITINNLTLMNANFSTGSVFIILENCSLTTNNVNFINNTASQKAIILSFGTYTSNDDRFVDCTSSTMGVIYSYDGELNFNNVYVTSSKMLDWGFIYTEVPGICITITNSVFENTTSKYTTAVRGTSRTIIRNSKFINLYSEISAGAVGVKDTDIFIVENCTFVNVTSEKNGGAIVADIAAEGGYSGNVSITDSQFIDCNSEFGGAIMQLGGVLFVDNCEFINNSAVFDGGAIFMSYIDFAVISNSEFIENAVYYYGARKSCGGAIYVDLAAVSLVENEFINNSAQCGGALYFYQSGYEVINNTFADNVNLDGNIEDVYSQFEAQSYFEGNTYSGNDSLSLNKTRYEFVIDSSGMKLALLNNTIVLSELPSKFDLRDWKWVTPVRDQGRAGACWTFGSSAAMESAILRYLGIEMDLSENNLEDLSLVYSHYGVYGTFEGGTTQVAAAYALSWFGVISSDYDPYDQLGKVSPVIAANNSVHFLDVVFVPVITGPDDIDGLKQAILKYGALAITYAAAQTPPYLNVTSSAQYYNISEAPDHCVAVVGWDDSYSADNFIITPPENGAWIIKNSWGEDVGDEGYYYVSYYDKTFATDYASVAYVLENTVDYNKNYQYDIEGDLNTIPAGQEYANEYVALEDDLVAAVGTYFNDTNVEYEVEVYVNYELKLSQSGISPFIGYHTIKLNSYIPIKKGDVIRVIIKSNSIPLFANSRQIHIPGSSMAKIDGNWINVTDKNMVCSVKVYTVEDNVAIINNQNVTVEYGSGSYFSVCAVSDDGIGVMDVPVNFTVDGKPISVLTDKDGVAKFLITCGPGVHEVTTTYNNQTYKNSITVNLDIESCKLTGNKNIAVDYTGGSYFSVKVTSADGKIPVKGESVIFIFNGNVVTAKTDKNGIAKIKITALPGKYTITTLYKDKTYTNKVTLNQVLTTSKVTVKKTAKKFTLKAKLKINGKLVKGKKITFKFNGKTYKATTDKKGVAKVTIKKSVIKKLKKGKTYVVKVTYSKDTIKSSVKVK